jgi:hypothetical protein
MTKRVTYPSVGLTTTDIIPAVQKDAFKFLVDNLYQSIFSAVRGTNNINFYYQYTIDRYMVFHYTFVYLLSQYDSNSDFAIIHSQIASLIGYLVRDFDLITNPKNNFQLENILFTTFVFLKTLLTFLNKTKFRLTGNLENLNRLMNSLITCYFRYQSYHVIITSVFKEYTNLLTSQDYQYHNILLREQKLVTTMVHKLSKNINNLEFIAIIDLIRLLVKQPDIFTLVEADSFFLFYHLSEIFTEGYVISEYEENEVGVSHIKWCWCLDLLGTISYHLKTTRSQKVVKKVISFLKQNDKRIRYVLENSEYISQQRNDNTKTLPYLVELNLLTNIYVGLFQVHTEWISLYTDYYIRIICTLMEKTMKLFNTSIRLTNHYQPITELEKKLAEIIEANVYIPNMYIFLVRYLLNTSLYNITRIIATVVKENIFYSHLTNNIKDAKFVREFDDMTQNISNSIAFKYQTLEHLTNQSKMYEIYFSKSMVYLSNYSSMNSLGFLSSFYSGSKYIII